PDAGDPAIHAQRPRRAAAPGRSPADHPRPARAPHPARRRRRGPPPRGPGAPRTMTAFPQPPAGARRERLAARTKLTSAPMAKMVPDTYSHRRKAMTEPIDP